jgi:hypothetical protein
MKTSVVTSSMILILGNMREKGVQALGIWYIGGGG